MFQHNKKVGDINYHPLQSSFNTILAVNLFFGGLKRVL
jgi:hypothetical protein